MDSLKFTMLKLNMQIPISRPNRQAHRFEYMTSEK